MARPSAAARRGSQRGQVSGFNPNWDADWVGALVQVTERGWETELAIPLRTLRYVPGDGQDVGLQRRCATSAARTSRSTSSPIPRGYNDLPCLAGVKKITRTSSSPDAATSKSPPTASAAPTRTISPPPSARRSEFDLGLDVKWGVTPEPDGGLHSEHRLRSGRSGRPADQLDPLPALFSREAALHSSRTRRRFSSARPRKSTCSSPAASASRRVACPFPILAGAPAQAAR